MFRSWFTTAHSQKYTGSLYLFPQSEGNFRGTRYYLISVFSTALVVAGLLPLDKIFKNPCMFQLLHLHTILTNVLQTLPSFQPPHFQHTAPISFFLQNERKHDLYMHFTKWQPLYQSSNEAQTHNGQPFRMLYHQHRNFKIRLKAEGNINRTVHTKVKTYLINLCG